ncbi:T9SS type A sorting domain-containing protein [Candidatus Neomarinimicrobiota bacterium]
MTSLMRRVLPFILITAATGILLSGRGSDRRSESLERLHSIVATQFRTPGQVTPLNHPNQLVKQGQRLWLAPILDITPAERMAKQNIRLDRMVAAGKSPARIKVILAANKTEVGTGTLSGFIFAEDGTTPLSDMFITLYDEFGNSIDYEYTDDSGAYQFIELATGNYYVRVYDYLSIEVYYENETIAAYATPIAVVDGQDTPGINFIIQKARVITGRIFEPDSITPIPYLQGRIYQYYLDYDYGRIVDSWAGSEKVSTDENGVYFVNVFKEEVKLHLDAEGYEGTYFGHPTWLDSATIIAVNTTDDTLRNIDFFVTPVAIVDDGIEPNNKPATATTITYDQIISTAIDPRGDIDYFTFQGTEGDTITIDIDAQINLEVMASPLDTYLYLLDSSGTEIIAENNDFVVYPYEYYSYDSRIENVVLAYTGTYFLKVSTYYSDGGPDHTYSITLFEDSPPPAPVDPYEPNDLFTLADTISYGDTVEAFLYPEDEDDYYKFFGIAGDTITIQVQSRSIGSGVSAYVSLLDSVGILRWFSISSSSDSRIQEYILPYTGAYHIQIWGYLSYQADPTNSRYMMYLFKGVLHDWGGIAGRILDMDGEDLPITGHVYAYPADNQNFGYLRAITVYSEDCCGYTIDRLPADYYKIRYIPSNDDTTFYATTWYNGMDDWEYATPVAVTAGDTTPGIDIIVSAGAGIHGAIEFPHGFLTANYYSTSIRLIDAVTSDNPSVDTYLNFAGGFEMNSAGAGSFKLAAVHLHTNLPTTYYGGGASYGDAASSTLVLEANSTTVAKWNTQSAGPGSITGAVYQENNALLSHYSWWGYMLVYDTDGYIVQSAQLGYDFVTDEGIDRGKYRISGLPEGDYYVLLMANYLDNYLVTDSVYYQWYQDDTPVENPLINDMYHANIPTQLAPVTLTAAAPIIADADFHTSLITNSVTEIEVLPDEFALHQNYPNPFNPTTTIRFDLPENSQVKLLIYDVLGHVVTKLVDETRPVGYHQIRWDGRNSIGRQVASGIYFARIVTPNYTKSMKMLLLK